jgi:hypothetical protein
MIRDTLWELFPDLIFFDFPVNDDSIAGLAIVNDNGPNFVLVYDETQSMTDIISSFQNKEEAEKFLKCHVTSAYLGETTPMFIQTFDVFAGTRSNKYLNNYKLLFNFDSIDKAFDFIDQNPDYFIFLHKNDIDLIKEMA